jgi:hypothetical protein
MDFMKSFIIIIVLCAVTGLLSFSFSRTYARHRFYEDSLENDRLKYMNLVMASIKGKEKMRADSVFKNLKVIKGESSISAEHLLWMMNWGWSAELGVSCSHCHINGKWESDSLNTKDIARGMWNMRVQINQQILPGITGKNYWNKPAVTCLTCHRGKPVPDNKF